MTDDAEAAREALRALDLAGPGDQPVEAVLAVRDYLRTHGPTTRAEVIDGIVPEETHPIGHNATAAAAKLGGYDGFRVWWWDAIVEPGLRVLSDVEPPDEAGGEWAVVDD